MASKKLTLISMFAILAVIVGVASLEGRTLWNKLLEMHGIRPRSTAHLPKAWPGTAAGQFGRRWLEAYNTGEDAMRDFLMQNMAEESLKQRPLEERMESYRSSRQRFGSFKLDGVVRSEANEVVVDLLPATGASVEFTITNDQKPPGKLLSVVGKQVLSGH